MIKMKIILFCLPAIIAGVIVGAILISTASDKINERKEYHGFSPILAFLFMVFCSFCCHYGSKTCNRHWSI